MAVSAFNLDGDTVTTEMIKDRIEKAHRAADQTDMKVLDGMTKQKVDEFNSEITRWACTTILLRPLTVILCFTD